MSINARLVLHFVVYLGKAGKRGAMPERQQPLFQPEKRERATVFMKLKKYIKSIVVFFITLMAESFKIVFGGYFKAQFKIMAVIGVILFIGFLILKVRFAILVAVLVAFLDMLPFLGTGTVLIPWAVFKLVSEISVMLWGW